MLDMGQPLPCLKSSSAGCSAGEASLVIDPWGNVKPCLHVDLLCGNILQQDFEKIWSSEPLRVAGIDAGCLFKL